jgi:hypothetical protein
MKERQMNKGRILVLVGSLVLTIGGFLPWISVPNLFSLSGPSYVGIEVGWEGDGFLTSSVGLILILGELLFGGVSRRWFTLTGVVLAALAASVVFLDFRRILEIAPEAGFYAATDVGIYVTLGGVLLVLIGCLSKRVSASTQHGVTISEAMV